MEMMLRRSMMTLVAVTVVMSCLFTFLSIEVGDIHINPQAVFLKKQASGRDSTTETFNVHTSPNHRSINRSLQEQFKVIILTYMRSGSSLTGDIIQQHPGVFYVFEPLWATERVYQGHISSPIYRLVDNTTVSVPKSSQELTTRYNQILNSFLYCRLEEVDVVTLTQIFMKFSLSTTDFWNCTQGNKNLSRIRLCLKNLTEACQKSQAIVLKVIRTNFQNIISIFTHDPQIRVIHLIRDPRGTLKSQFQVGTFKWRNRIKVTTELCNRIKNNIIISRNLSTKYPNKILTIRYEDITELPVETTKIIYKFLDLAFLSQIESYILNITYGGYPDGCNVCTNRRNATKTANRWRVKLPFFIVKDIQRDCQRVFEIMGYVSFEFKTDLRDLHQKSFRKFLHDRWLWL